MLCVVTGSIPAGSNMGPRISSEAAPSYCPPEAQAALDQILEEDREIFEALARCSNTNTKNVTSHNSRFYIIL